MEDNKKSGEQGDLGKDKDGTSQTDGNASGRAGATGNPAEPRVDNPEERTGFERKSDEQIKNKNTGADSAAGK